MPELHPYSRMCLVRSLRFAARLSGLAFGPALGRITFGEYAEAWLESRADLKPKTRHQYQWLMRQQIMPTWRTVPLAKITFADLTQWVSRLSLSSGLGPSGIRQCVFVMSDEGRMQVGLVAALSCCTASVRIELGILRAALLRGCPHRLALP